MKKIVVVAVAALLVPSIALAKGPPSGHSSHGKAAPKVMYVFKGTISAYTAASGTAPGSITIMVNRANRHGWALKDQSLTLPLSSSTRIVLRHGAGAVTVGDRGIVKVKAPKSASSASDLQSALEASNAFQVIDQGMTGNSSSQGQGSGSQGKGAPNVMYVLKGVLSDYTAASGSTPGSITIMVNRANRHGWALKSLTLTFPVSSATRIVLRNGAGSITNDDRGIVKVKAPKSLSSASDLQSQLEASNPFQVIDQGVAAH